MKLVLVEWADSTLCTDGWVSKNYELELSKCCSVGVVTKETDKFLEMSLSVTPTAKAQVTTIPKIAITRIRYLKVK